MNSSAPKRIYLDNAATSWPKPESVYRASDQYQRENGAVAGRGAYDEAVQATTHVQRARRLVASLLGVNDPQRIALTYSGTDALNTALFGLLPHTRGHVITTELEHNSVLRPLTALAEGGQIELTILPPRADGTIAAEDVRAMLTEQTRLVAVTHASNVTGVLQPVAEIGRLTVQHPQCLLLVDACQTLGHLPINLGELNADLVAASGHKGLLGPLGTGLLYVGPRTDELLRPLRHGGTGSWSENLHQPKDLPERFEAGNHNEAGLVGLAEGAAYLRQRTVADVHTHLQRLTTQLLEALCNTPGVTIHLPDVKPHDRVGVVSISVAGYAPQELAAILASVYGIQTRAGLHCAPLAHRQLGTLETGGTVRLSCGPFTSADDIQQAGEAIAAIAATGKTA